MIEYRPLQPEDLDDLHAMVVRSERHDRLPISTPKAELAEIFDEPHFDPAQDGILAREGNAVVAWGRVWHRPSGIRLERAYIFGAVDPAHRRRGIGTYLVGRLMTRAQELLLSTGNELPRFIRTQVYDWQTDAIALYERLGMTPVRWFEELIRDLDQLPEAKAPSGVEIIRWDRNRGIEAREVKNSAFADHWGSTPISMEAWSKSIEEYGIRLDLSFMAIENGRIIGYSINEHFPEDQEISGRLDGWIGSLGVLAGHRKRGVASALIACSLQAFREAGFTHALLGVDSENPSGAAGLYRRLGFELRSRSVTHELQV